MKIHNIEQGADEWFEIRKGKATASHAQAIATNGKGLETYIKEVMAEYYSSGEKEQFSNRHTERGNELESLARDMYELETGNKVEQVGFIEHSEFIGASPDGLIDEDGGLEIKCVDDKKYFEILMEEKIDSAYVWQVQMNLLISKRKWWDLCYYNPNYKKSIKIFRIEPSKEAQEKLLNGFEKAEEKIKDYKEKYNNLTK